MKKQLSSVYPRDHEILGETSFKPSTPPVIVLELGEVFQDNDEVEDSIDQRIVHFSDPTTTSAISYDEHLNIKQQHEEDEHQLVQNITTKNNNTSYHRKCDNFMICF